MANPPDPLADFAAELRRYRSAAGQPSIRDLVALLRGAGQPYPRSTISDKLTGASKPTWEFVDAFVRACATFAGTPPEKLAADLAEWQRRFRQMRRGVVEPQATRSSAAAGPRQLPPDVAGFTGRAAEVAALDALLDRGGPALRIALLTGTAGAGKTALAVHWGHRVADRFPDGQLYTDLRGYDPAAPAAPERALDGFLLALGLSPAQLPFDLTDKASRFRSLLAGRRLLVVVDNAFAADQVRPLLPGDPGCLVVVTGRDRLAGLVTRQGATRVEVGQLPAEDAVVLLEDLIGARIRADPAGAGRLAARCAWLPLALRIAAESAVSDPTLTVAELADALDAERSVLDAFGDTDERADMRAVFSWSYRHLPDDAERLFRRLALHPGGAVSEAALAALAGTPDRGPVAALAAGHLIQPDGHGRWLSHDLLRAYAAEKLADEPAPERQAATRRLLDHYLATAAAAMDVVFPAEAAARPPVTARTVTPVRLPDARAGLDWLDTERATLLACLAMAAHDGHDDYAATLSALLWRYLDTGAHHAEALAVHQLGLDLARRRDDLIEEGRELARIGIVYWRWGRHTDALAALDAALKVNRKAGARRSEGGVHNTLGLVYTSIGDYRRAIAHLTAALHAARELGSAVGEASTLDNLGRTHRLWGHLAEAVACGEQALAVSNALGTGKILGNLASAYLLQGRLAEATERTAEALAVSQSDGDVIGIATAHETRAWIDLAEGRPQAALEGFDRVLDIQRETGDAEGRADTWAGVSAAYTALGRFADAADTAERAWKLAQAEGDPLAECAGRTALGHALLGGGNARAARDHFTAAYELARSIDCGIERDRAAAGLALTEPAGRPAGRSGAGQLPRQPG